MERDPIIGAGRCVLITGANGFIGKALCHELPQWGFQVVAAVRTLESATDEITPIRRFAIGNADENTDWTPALHGADSVVHLLARVHVMDDRSTDAFEEYRRVNLDATMNLARQAVATGVRRFVFVSSIKVNGESTLPGRPFTPDDPPRPEDFYGISKWEAEQALIKLAQKTGLEVVIIRPPLVYGRGAKANFKKIVRWVTRGIPLPFGSLDNRRSLVAIDNLVSFIRVCISDLAAANQVFLVSDGDDMSITELIVEIARISGKHIVLIPIPKYILRLIFLSCHLEAHASRLLKPLQVDISKNKEILGWGPPVSARNALTKTLQK